jgi:non-specific serine/threonine protein kinase
MAEEESALIQQLRKFQSPEINKFINRNSPFSGIWENIIQPEDEEMPADTRSLIVEYMLPKLKKMFREQKERTPFYFLPKGKSFITANLVPVIVSTDTLRPAFHVYPEKKKFIVECTAKVNEL